MKELLNELEQANYDAFFSNIKDLKLSASSIKLLLDSPKRYFNDYILGNKEVKKGKHFDEGSLVHCMVLEPENLNDKFINMGVPVPSENTKAVIDYLISLEKDDSNIENYSTEILDYLLEINLHQSLVDDKKAPFKSGDEKRLEKIINDNSIEYFRLMVEAREKTIVDSASWDKCYNKAKAILDNPDALFLLKKIKETDEIRVEFAMEDEVPGINYMLKGVLDAIKVDRENKTLYISDIKTTNGLLKDFPDVVETYNYWLQGAIYKLLAEPLLRGSAFDYKIIFNFVVVDRNDDVYCFKVNHPTLNRWVDRLTKVVNEQVEYHISNKDFTLPYDFANKLISL